MNDEALRDLGWNAVGYGIVVGVALMVVLALYLFTSMPRLLVLDRLRPVFWGGHEVFLACCAVIGLPAFATIALQQVGFFLPLLGDIPDFKTHKQEFIDYNIRSSVIASPLGLALTLAALFGFMFARSGARPHHYGLTWARWRSNLVLGLAATALATPVVLGVFALVKLIVPDRPERIVDAARQFHDWEWPLFAFQVVVAAPIMEEIVCRGILQSWLGRASFAGHLAILSLSVLSAWLGMSYVAADGTVQFDWTPIVFAVALAAAYGLLLFRLARRFDLHDTEVQAWHPDVRFDDPTMHAWRQANASLAVFGSATLFALSHASAWPAPVPLFLMGIVLGWLARRTQSLVAPIIYHATFNLISFIALYGMVTTQRAVN